MIRAGTAKSKRGSCLRVRLGACSRHVRESEPSASCRAGARLALMEAGVVLLVLGVVLFAGSALAAFAWAARDGQFENLDEAPGVIFDESEPAGERGDWFPGERGRDGARR
jgi:cbb3-type cytochrome oxidase maturation protein